MILYNLFPLLAGPFSKWDAHFARAAGMGFDWVFINPIQQSGASRSLYSIADYFRINPSFLDPQSAASAEEQVRQMTAQARASGLKVMIDLVINHCAIDAALTRQHPEWFVREANGKIANSGCQHNGEKVVWKDLAKFDHDRSRDAQGLHRYCVSVVEHLMGLGFEGFRCDAAYQVPQQAWRRLIREVKARHPHTVFLAETLGCSADQTKDMGFEFGLRTPLHVIQTTPMDWQMNGTDLCSYITKVNAIKRGHRVFLEESPTSILPCQNPNVLLLWKASAKHKDEALLILNKDQHHHQEFYTQHFRHFVQAGAPLRDVSPEYPLEYIHEPFHYALRPGQGIVLVTSRT